MTVPATFAVFLYETVLKVCSWIRFHAFNVDSIDVYLVNEVTNLM